MQAQYYEQKNPMSPSLVARRFLCGATLDAHNILPLQMRQLTQIACKTLGWYLEAIQRYVWMCSYQHTVFHQMQAAGSEPPVQSPGHRRER